MSLTTGNLAMVDNPLHFSGQYGLWLVPPMAGIMVHRGAATAGRRYSGPVKYYDYSN